MICPHWTNQCQGNIGAFPAQCRLKQFSFLSQDPIRNTLCRWACVFKRELPTITYRTTCMVKALLWSILACRVKESARDWRTEVSLEWAVSQMEWAIWKCIIPVNPAHEFPWSHLWWNCYFGSPAHGSFKTVLGFLKSVAMGLSVRDSLVIVLSFLGVARGRAVHLALLFTAQFQLVLSSLGFSLWCSSYISSCIQTWCEMFLEVHSFSCDA